MISIYITPNPTSVQITELEELFNFIDRKFSKHKYIISGDFNLNFFNNKLNIVQIFKKLLNKYGLFQMTKSYTYPSSPFCCVRKSLLDLFIVNDKTLVQNLTVTESISIKFDHFSILTLIKIHKEKEKVITKLVHDLNDNDIEIFKSKVNSFDWDSLINSSPDINLIYESFINTIKVFISSTFKKKQLSNKSRSIPKEIKQLIVKKSKIFKIFSQTNEKFYYFYACFLYEKINKLIESYNSKKFHKIIDKSKDLKQLFSHIKHDSKQKNANIFRDNENNVISDDQDICNAFSKHFVSTFNEINFPDYSKLIPICNEKLDNFTITQTDVLRELLSLDYNKASGPSEIPNLLLKKCPQIFSKILYQLFQKILISGIIPDKLKIVSVTPILKKGKPINEISSYRPITVENNLLKLFEKLIFNNINAHIVKNDLIPDSQYGFRAGLNTQN